jgi:hypothetical protein
MKTREAVLREIEQRTAVLVLTGLSQKQAHKQAMREVAAREKAKAEAAGVVSTPVSPDTSGLTADHIALMETFSRWIHHVWSRAEQGMERVRRKNKQPKPTMPEPSMGSAPVVVYEPSPPLSADPKLQAAFPGPLVVADFSRAKIIPQSELGPPVFQDHVTEAWRKSIQQNEQINKERAARFLQLQNRNRGRYVG